MTKKEKKKKKKTSETIKQFFNSPISIIIALIILSISLLIYSRYLIKVNEVYQFSGYKENISILNGTIYTNYDVNYFGDSKIYYDGEDIELKEFEVGYYIKDGSNYNDISIVKNNEEIGESASLKLLLNTTDFSFTETHKDSMYLSKENIKNLDNLVFRIKGVDKEDKDIEIEIPLVATKINK